MTVNKKFSKTDANHKQIREELRALGYDVDDVHYIPRLYDIIVCGVAVWCKFPVCVRVEIKMPGERLTEPEQDYWNKQKHFGTLIKAECTKDVVRWFRGGE